jgi:hypothetical protein
MAAKETVPTWGYRRGADGELVARLFDLPAGKPALPKGWADSPSKAVASKPARKAAASRRANGA